MMSVYDAMKRSSAVSTHITNLGALKNGRDCDSSFKHLNKILFVYLFNVALLEGVWTDWVIALRRTRFYTEKIGSNNTYITRNNRSITFGRYGVLVI